MSAAVAIDVKGWCPGILRPMRSGDGLIVRVRPHGGAFSLAEACALAELATRLGNGHIDLTRRANLQLRGVTESTLPDLQAALGRLGLVDADTAVEAVRNVMAAPLGSGVRMIAHAIERALTSDRRLRGLPSKFGLLVDEAGSASIAGERADIALCAVGGGIAVGLDTCGGTRWLGACAADAAADVAVKAMHAFLDCAPRRRMRDLPEADHAAVQAALMPLLSALPPFEVSGGRKLGLLDGAVGVAAPFGRLEAPQLRRLADLAADAGARELRLSPWRAVYVEVRNAASGRALLESAHAAGLIIEESDPILSIETCPGMPDCKSSSVDARGDGRRMAALAKARGFAGSIHVSGCAKGCARSAPSELVLVGDRGRYGVVRNATTRGPIERLVDANDLVSTFPGAAHG